MPSTLPDRIRVAPTLAGTVVALGAVTLLAGNGGTWGLLRLDVLGEQATTEPAVFVWTAVCWDLSVLMGATVAILIAHTRSIPDSLIQGIVTWGAATVGLLLILGAPLIPSLSVDVIDLGFTPMVVTVLTILDFITVPAALAGALLGSALNRVERPRSPRTERREVQVQSRPARPPAPKPPDQRSGAADGEGG